MRELPYIVLRQLDHNVVGVTRSGRTFSEPTEHPRAWAEGFLVGWRAAGGSGEILEPTK
jgi:hypothetical protein